MADDIYGNMSNMNIDELNVWHIIHTIDILYIKVN